MDRVVAVLSVALANIRQRYATMSGGLIWTVLRPLLLAGIFTVVFGGIFGGRSSYVVWMLSGFIPWIFTDEAVRSGARTYLSQSSLLRSHQSHPELLAAISAAEGAILLGAGTGAVWLVYLAGVRPLSASDLLIPLAVFVAFLTIWGAVLLAALLVTVIRDLEPLIEPVMTVVFWSAPVVYRPEVLPVRMRVFLEWWPPAAWARIWQALVGEGAMPVLTDIAVALGTAAVLLLSGLLLTRWRVALITDRV